MRRNIPRPRLSRSSSARGVCQGKQKARAQYGSLVRRSPQSAVGDSLHRDADDCYFCSRRPPGIQLLVTGLGRDVSWQVRTASFRLLADIPNAGRDPIHGRGCADAFLRINFFTSWTERRTKVLNGRTGSNYLSAHRGPIGPIYLPVGAPRIAEILHRRGSGTVEENNT